MSKKDYSLKFYKAVMINENDERYNFYLAERDSSKACQFVENYVFNHSDRYHIIPGENNIKNIYVTEVPIEKYGREYGYEVLN